MAQTQTPFESPIVPTMSLFPAPIHAAFSCQVSSVSSYLEQFLGISLLLKSLEVSKTIGLSLHRVCVYQTSPYDQMQAMCFCQEHNGNETVCSVHHIQGHTRTTHPNTGCHWQFTMLPRNVISVLWEALFFRHILLLMEFPPQDLAYCGNSYLYQLLLWWFPSAEYLCPSFLCIISWNSIVRKTFPFSPMYLFTYLSIYLYIHSFIYCSFLRV